MARRRPLTDDPNPIVGPHSLPRAVLCVAGALSAAAALTAIPLLPLAYFCVVACVVAAWTVRWRAFAVGLALGMSAMSALFAWMLTFSVGGD